jgi:high affinity sulfate transporter 1
MPKAYTPSVFRYKKKYLKSDLIAALIVTAIAIPESLGFAAIVGLPLVAGLYSALLAPIVFGLVASTRRLVIGADSATAALVAAGAVLVAQAGTAEYANAIVALGLLTGLILIVMAVCKMGFLADLISRPVLVGFMGGVGVQLIIMKLPEMLGIKADGSISNHLMAIIQHAGSINGMTLTISILVVGIVMIVRKTRIPGQLIGLVLASVFAVLFHVSNYGVKMVGALPQGLPTVPPLHFSFADLVVLLPAAFSIAVVILAQSSAVIRNLAHEHDDSIKLNQDLFALGLANAASALTRGFAVNGSPPRSAAADMAGGRSQLVNIIMSGLIAALLLFGGHLFGYVPAAALASIVFLIGFHLIRFEELQYLWDRHRTEFMVAMIALLGTALFGVLQGVLIAVVVSLMERLSRQYHPKDEILLRDGKLSEWARERVDQHHRHSNHPAGLLVYSFESSLFFENVSYFRSRLLAAIKAAKQPVHHVIIDAGAMESVDYTAIEVIKQLFRQLSADDIRIGFAHVSPSLFDQFEEYGLLDIVGKKHVFSTLNEAIKSQPGNTRSAVEMVKVLGINSDEYVVIGGAVLEALHLRKTNDIDLAVSDAVYEYYRTKEHWQEYVQDNGKKILSHNGYNMMHGWMGKSFTKLRKGAFLIEEVPFMGIDELIAAKRQLARKKDLSDIELLVDYQTHHQ